MIKKTRYARDGIVALNEIQCLQSKILCKQIFKRERMLWIELVIGDVLEVYSYGNVGNGDIFGHHIPTYNKKNCSSIVP